jgi:hypothetical protein
MLMIAGGLVLAWFVVQVAEAIAEAWWGHKIR